MMKITGLSHIFKWENLHNWWLTKYFFAPLYIYIYIYIYSIHIYIYIYIYIYSIHIYIYSITRILQFNKNDSSSNSIPLFL